MKVFLDDDLISGEKRPELYRSCENCRMRYKCNGSFLECREFQAAMEHKRKCAELSEICDAVVQSVLLMLVIIYIIALVNMGPSIWTTVAMFACINVSLVVWIINKLSKKGD